jgi:hypothetical protein
LVSLSQNWIVRKSIIQNYHIGISDGAHSGSFSVNAESTGVPNATIDFKKRRRLMLRQKAREIIRLPFAMFARYRDWQAMQTKPHEVAICAIFRQEAPFLADWITFHRKLGVSRFYLYNNFSTDNFREVLAPFTSDGSVVLYDWPVEVGQLPAYRHCLKFHWRDARWIAFIDIDEFLFSADGRSLAEALRPYARLPGVHVWQAFFGASGHARRPTLPVPLAYTMRAPLTQTAIKTIANPRHVYKAGVHDMKFWAGKSLDTAGRGFARGQAPVLDQLRINHYWSRSIDDLHQKVARGDASTAGKRDLAWHLDFETKLNAEKDESIIRLAGQAFDVFGTVPETDRI